VLVSLKDPNRMNVYMAGVLAKANHHARNVVDVIKLLRLVVAGYASDMDVSLRASGKLGSTSWFVARASGRRYYLRYNYAGHIDLCRDGKGGAVIATFSNQSTASELTGVFDTL